MEPFYPKGVAEDIAAKSGARLLVLPAEVGGSPQARSYVGVFETVFAALRSELGATSPADAKKAGSQ
jgi:hypothetical protein